MDKDKQITAKDILNTALQNLDSEQIKVLRTKAAEEALNIHSREMNRDSLEIRSRKEAEDHVATFNDLTKEGRVAHEVVTKSATATGTRTITSRSGTATAKSACFIATSAFNDINHDTVSELRYWRDVSLIKYKYGRAFIKWYYKNGPTMANWLDHHSQFKPLIRSTLNMFVKLIRPS